MVDDTDDSKWEALTAVHAIIRSFGIGACLIAFTCSVLVGFGYRATGLLICMVFSLLSAIGLFGGWLFVDGWRAVPYLDDLPRATMWIALVFIWVGAILMFAGVAAILAFCVLIAQAGIII